MSDDNSDTSATPPCLSCPSTVPSFSERVIILGVIGGTPTEPRLTYLSDEVPLTQEVLDMAGTLNPEAVFRFAGACSGAGCAQFDGNRCGVVKHVVGTMPEVVDSLPVCRLRPTCRWWHEEGKAACLRCPAVAHSDYIRVIPSLQEMADRRTAKPGSETSPE